MLENQIVQKSSELTDVNVSGENYSESSGRIYFDPQQAIEEFEAETRTEKHSSQDPRVEKFLLNARLLAKHREYSLALNLLLSLIHI